MPKQKKTAKKGSGIRKKAAKDLGLFMAKKGSGLSNSLKAAKKAYAKRHSSFMAKLPKNKRNITRGGKLMPADYKKAAMRNKRLDYDAQHISALAAAARRRKKGGTVASSVGKFVAKKGVAVGKFAVKKGAAVLSKARLHAYAKIVPLLQKRLAHLEKKVGGALKKINRKK